MKKLPVWKGNPEPGIFAHVSWAADEILSSGPKLPTRSDGPCPHEGLAFAVSRHPDAWARIARIGREAPVVVLQFPMPALDYYRFLGDRWIQEVPEVTDWAVKNGWITKGRDYLVYTWDGEEDEERVSRFPEGHEDVTYYMQQFDLGPDADEEVIKMADTPGWRYTQKLRDRISKHYVNPNDTCMEAEVFNLWLQAEHPEFGMIWYDEILDAPGLSAPRGAILPAYFDKVSPIRVGSVGEWVDSE